MKHFLFLSSLIFFLSGCSPTIGNHTEFSKITFTAGKTQKTEVADTIGLPANISHSEALGQEYWAYKQGSTTTGIMFASPSGNTYPSSTGESTDYDFEDAAVVYVFDKGGVLMNVRHMDKNK